MKYCSACGKELLDEAVICVGCGTPCEPPKPVEPERPAPEPEVDEPNAGFTILGVFFPLIGLILYLVYHDKMPKKANSAGKGALIGVLISVGMSVLTFVGTIIYYIFMMLLSLIPYLFLW